VARSRAAPATLACSVAADRAAWGDKTVPFTARIGGPLNSVMRTTPGFCLLTTLCVTLACSDAQESTNFQETGGMAPTGGQPSAGGQTATGGSATGGAFPATGGLMGTGGVGGGSGGAPTGGTASGGSPPTGGSSSGGMPTGGAAPMGGSASGGWSTGGSPSGGVSTGGVPTGGTASGGMPTGGMPTGGMPTGGMPTGGFASGGAASGGLATGGTSTGGVSTGGTGGDTGGCERGRIAASEVIIMGESFYAFQPPYIQYRIEENARNAGALGPNESYRNMAISGQPMSVVAGEYDTALQGGPVKVVIMDGGGIDCMSSSCPSCPGTFETLLQKMATNGVEDVIYTRYPEPGNPPGSNTTLKNNLDALMPQMEQVCAAATGLRCHWVDLRPVWQNGDTNDGLHPTESGGEHCGDAIWAKMVEECIAQ